ncbi:hypothetical protein like AT2G03810 [Hibiscus trionum]|uniref:Uncharacterized protein n=1 Tax=Hibiscus trionum TaxID=183268 RepID=A0A9W7JB29_HIBTR|nr:hypothetical protein like AT2G03810 [Hibiscus trionum]
MRATDFVRSDYNSSKNIDSFQDSVFYLDKRVMESNLPELVVCYKENTYHVVKDIYIDEGVLTQDKFVFDSGTDEKFLPSEKDLDAKLMKENSEMDMSINDIDNEWGSKKKLDADACIQDVSLLQENNKSNEGVPNQCVSKNLILSSEMKHDAMQMITDDVSKELYTLGLGELTLMSEMSLVKTESVCSYGKSDGTEQQSFQNSSEKEVTGTPYLVSPAEESNDSSEEAILSGFALVSAAEESDPGKGEATLISSVPATVESSSSCLVNEVSNDSRLEGGRITSHFDSSAPTSSIDECSHKLDSEPLEIGSASKPEDRADQPFSNILQRGNGECSFSLAGPVTGLITYSGPIAYSGNLSLRSDSSTTSTRSFAFPILQPEWDTSPIRMAKADRRKYRKRRGWSGWRQGILCCRF